MVNKFIIICLLFVFSGAYARGQRTLVNLTVQVPHSKENSPLIYSASVFSLVKKNGTYMETGIIAQPNLNDDPKAIIDEVNYEKKYDHSLFGLYGGYHIMIFPIFRPGVIGGLVMQKERVFSGSEVNNLVLTSETDYEFSTYLGLSIQLGIFTLQITNLGAGGGLNFAI